MEQRQEELQEIHQKLFQLLSFNYDKCFYKKKILKVVLILLLKDVASWVMNNLRIKKYKIKQYCFWMKMVGGDSHHKTIENK